MKVIDPKSANKTDRHNITEIVLKVALNIIKQTKKHVVVYNNNKYYDLNIATCVVDYIVW